ncbi:MAG: hypothetical protein PW788_04790 [Micavibrio sp.]|nr:hypothetical protein [Micavibrio sp.]
MDFFKKVAILLFVPGVIVLVWDIVEQFFVHNTFKIRSFKEWGQFISSTGYMKLQNGLHVVFPSQICENIGNYPAPLVFIVPAVVSYLLYRIFFMVFGGKGGGGSGIVYKSRH